MKNEKITDGAFDFFYGYCKYCNKIIKPNEIFCDIECGASYFKELQERRDKSYVSKKQQAKKRIFGLSDILNPEQLKEMKKITENNIKRILNES